MLTLPPVRLDRPMFGGRISGLADRRSSFAPAAYADVGTPVTTYSQAAKAHRVASAILDAVIEALPVGLLVVDRDGEVSFANAAARALGTDALPLLQAFVARALRTDRVLCEVFTVGAPAARTRLDSRRSLSVRAVPCRNDGARPHAFVVTVHDITAQARADSWEPVIASLMSL